MISREAIRKGLINTAKQLSNNQSNAVISVNPIYLQLSELLNTVFVNFDFNNVDNRNTLNKNFDILSEFANNQSNKSSKQEKKGWASSFLNRSKK